MKMLRREKGFTLIEIMIVVAIIALLAAIAIPNVLRGRTSANEAAAIGNLRALVSSLEMFRSVNNAYPAAWQNDMYTVPDPDFGPPNFNVAMTGQLIQGFNYTYTKLPAGCTNAAGNECTGYELTANPNQLGRTGTRAFFVNEAGTLRHCTGAGPATDTDSTIDVAPVAC